MKWYEKVKIGLEMFRKVKLCGFYMSGVEVEDCFKRLVRLFWGREIGSFIYWINL